LKALVVDASVVLKWCLPARLEPHTERAAELMDLYEAGAASFLAPDLLWAEVGNGLWKAVRGGGISSAHADAAVELLQELKIGIVRSAELLPQALHIAMQHDRTVYDSLYVAAAMRAGCDLITADERLAHALAARFPVKWLGGL